MNPQLLVNKKQIGLIHVAKAGLVARGVLDEEGYRDLLAQFQKADGTPVASSKDLVEAQADEMLAHFKKCGWVYVPKAKGPPGLSKAQRNKQIHLEAIGVTLAALGQDWAYAEGIAKQMFKLERVVWNWFSPERLHKIYVALVYQERREAGDPPQPRPETLAKRRARRDQDWEELPF